MTSPRRLLVFLRRDVLAAVSIFGLAINLIGSLGPFILLANVARYIVEHWVEVTSVLWIWLLGLVGLHIPPLFGFALTLLLFHIGLVASAYRRDPHGDEAAAALEARTSQRDRLLALLLYLPIMAGTLMTAFATLAHDAVSRADPPNSVVVLLSFVVVVASPATVFYLARPRLLIRRFLSIYVVAAFILVLDAAARLIEKSGLGKAFGEA